MTTRKPFAIPLKPKAQTFFINLGSTRYKLNWRFNSVSQSWMLDIADNAGVPLVNSIPAITGLDLLAPHRHLGIQGSIIVQTDHDPDAVPTYANLGIEGRAYFIVTQP